jgi:hypothetical protein
MRGLISSMLQVEAVRKAQVRYGKGKRITGEQMRWGLENLNLDQKTLDGLGLCRRDASGADLLPRSHGFGLGAHSHLGRQEVELHFRLVPGRREGAASAGDAAPPASMRKRRRSSRALRKTARSKQEAN